MKLKFLHDSMMFDKNAAKEVHLKKGQTVDIPDEDVGAFLSGENPRAEIVKEKAAFEEEQKPEPVDEVKPEPEVNAKAEPKAVGKAIAPGQVVSAAKNKGKQGAAKRSPKSKRK